MFHGRVVEEVTPVETTVWNCCSEKCLAWVRDDFKSAEVPICPICKSAMAKGMKMLPAIDNLVDFD